MHAHNGSQLTDDVAVDIFVLNTTQRIECRLFHQSSDCIIVVSFLLLHRVLGSSNSSVHPVREVESDVAGKNDNNVRRTENERARLRKSLGKCDGASGKDVWR